MDRRSQCVSGNIRAGIHKHPAQPGTLESRMPGDEYLFTLVEFQIHYRFTILSAFGSSSTTCGSPYLPHRFTILSMEPGRFPKVPPDESCPARYPCIAKIPGVCMLSVLRHARVFPAGIVPE